MACDITSGRILDCKDSVGGIKAVYIGNYLDMPNQANWAAASNDTVTAIGAQTFFEFELRPELSSLTVNYNSDPSTGTTFFEQVLSLTFQKLTATDIADIRLLCQGRPNIWVLDNSDNCWLIGAEHGCNVTGGSLQTGVAMGDLVGFTMDFTAKETNPVWLATASAGLGVADYPLDNVTNATVTTA
jgi:hypothetical protein